MSQFDYSIYFSQIFWLIINLSIIIIFNYFYLFPNIKKIISKRNDNSQKNQINEIYNEILIIEKKIQYINNEKKKIKNKILSEAFNYKNNKIKELQSIDKLKIKKYFIKKNTDLESYKILLDLSHKNQPLSKINQYNLQNKEELEYSLLKINNIVNKINNKILKVINKKKVEL